METIQRYIALKARQEALEGQLKDLNAELAECEKEALDYMTKQGMVKATTKSGKLIVFKRIETLSQSERLRAVEQGFAERIDVPGRTVFATRQIWARINPECENVVDLLKARGLDYLVKPTVNANSLSAYMRELVDNNKPMDIDTAAYLQELEQEYEGAVKLNYTVKLSARKTA